MSEGIKKKKKSKNIKINSDTDLRRIPILIFEIKVRYPYIQLLCFIGDVDCAQGPSNMRHAVLEILEYVRYEVKQKGCEHGKINVVLTRFISYLDERKEGKQRGKHGQFTNIYTKTNGKTK